MFNFDIEDSLPAILLCFCVAIIALVLVASYKSEKEWEQFKVVHNCKVVAKVKGEIFNTFGTDMKGNMSVGIASTSDKTGYACDDGVTYYR